MNLKLISTASFAVLLTACASNDTQMAHQVNILGERVDTLTAEVNELKSEQAATQKALEALKSQVEDNSTRVENVTKTFKK